MTQDALPCMICGSSLDNVFPDESENQPDDGVAFTTHGHYGSTVFDPMDGTFLEINICDICLKNSGEKDRVYVGKNRRMVLCEGSFAGWEMDLDRPLILWTKYLPEFGRDDVVNVDYEQIASGIYDDRINWGNGIKAYARKIVAERENENG